MFHGTIWVWCGHVDQTSFGTEFVNKMGASWEIGQQKESSCVKINLAYESELVFGGGDNKAGWVVK